MALLTQERFPRLWNSFQYFFGDYNLKYELNSPFVENFQTIVEVGCSTGELAAKFSSHSFVRYVGVDIDPKAVETAKSLDLDNRYEFVVADITKSDEIIIDDPETTLILLASMIHHISDDQLLDLLHSLRHHLKGASVVISDPELERATYSWRARFFYRLERGNYRRSLVEVLNILVEIGIPILRVSEGNGRPRAALRRPSATMWSIFTQI